MLFNMKYAPIDLHDFSHFSCTCNFVFNKIIFSSLKGSESLLNDIFHKIIEQNSFKLSIGVIIFLHWYQKLIYLHNYSISMPYIIFIQNTE